MKLEPLNLRQFLISYFTANHCHIIEQTDHLLKVKLTEEMDRAIMNRPFYWQYIKAIGQQGEPLELTLYIDQINQANDQKQDMHSDYIHFGSPKLHTIFEELNQSAQFVRLFEEVNTTKNTMLYPWLVMNIRVAYEGKQKKEELFSVGLQLINGTIVLNMMEQLNKISLHQQISNYCYTISPLIKLESGYNRIQTKVKNIIQNRSYQWADDSLEALNEEIQLINHFYSDEKDENKKMKEIQEANDRYKPKVTIKPFSGGLFYLTDSFIKK